MKYLPVPDFEVVTTALNFDAPDCSITGGCDLYTTKSTGSDKKLYKTIDRDLSAQRDARLKLGNSLPSPDRQVMLASAPDVKHFSRSPFGPLSELSNRRTFGYLIATLNASHPHYDFSHVLRPAEFKRERNLRRVIANLDSILENVRAASATPADPRLSTTEPNHSPAVSGAYWGPQCWALIDKEMRLNECTLFSYNPDVDPFAEDESAIWAAHYFFFSRSLKRVAYLYVRIVPVLSCQSPPVAFSRVTVRDDPDRKRRRAAASVDSTDGAKKRARYWLGDRAELVEAYGPDDDETSDDGLYWNRDDDGGLKPVDDCDDEPYDDNDDERNDVPHHDDDIDLDRHVRNEIDDPVGLVET